MQRTVRLSLGLTLLAALFDVSPMTIVPAAAQFELATPKAVHDIRTSVAPATIRPGESFTVGVDLAIEKGMHIQAAKPLQDYLIGTELEPDPAEDITWQDARFPNPTERVDPTLGTLAEYTTHLKIELTGAVQPNAKPGTRPITLHLKYQACTDQGSCYPPTTVTIEAALHIVAGPTASQLDPAATPAHPQAPSPARSKPPLAQSPAISDLLPWEAFSARRLAELTAAGKTVLIDFTADWCPNCKLNELIALDTRQTADLVGRDGVVPLKADFTREDREIRDWLAKFNSISVPLTVIVPGGNPTHPILLRDTFRQVTLLAALDKAGPSVNFNKLPQSVERSGLTLQTPITLSEPTSATWWYLLAGFLGGFVLNFMPCVLPVISIKIISLLGQAGQSRGRVFGLGLAFSAGMLALFLILGLLIVVAGQTWGALFQSSTFLLIMLGIIVAMACSLFGAFTLTVPAVVGDADAAIEGEGYVGSFGKGMLAVLLGTPCSGPLLGSALAWAASKSAAGHPVAALLVFAAMGLGMASPFLVLAAKPGWMRYLPRPGAWMETFKQFMGFLLLLTAVYILYLLQARLLMALLFSLGIAFAAWLYGKLVNPRRSPRANWLGRALVAALIAIIVWASFGRPTASPTTDQPAKAGQEAEALSPEVK